MVVHAQHALAAALAVVGPGRLVGLAFFAKPAIRSSSITTRGCTRHKQQAMHGDPCRSAVQGSQAFVSAVQRPARTACHHRCA
jgi:hypothetical protein